MESYELIDALSQLECTTVKCLDDGYVKLVEVSPRLIVKGRTCDDAIVKAARISYGRELRDIKADHALIDYLFRHYHTSPFEQATITFKIRCPIFVARHIVRHRTARLNEYSLRYSTMKDAYFSPLSIDNGIRFQDTVNKQSSLSPDEMEGRMEEKRELARQYIERIDEHLNAIQSLYHNVVDLGVAREIARYCLPLSSYTEMVFQIDLNNFLKFLSLRNDPHTQYETRVFAEAMENLARFLFPATFRAYDDRKNGVFLTTSDMEHMKDLSIPFSSKTQEQEFKIKMERLKITQ